MRIQAAVLVDDDDTGELRGHRAARVGADRPDQIPLDASVALRRGDGFVGSFDALIALRDLLAKGVVWHEGLRKRGDGDAGGCEFLETVHEVAAADFTVDEEIVELDGFDRDSGFG